MFPATLLFGLALLGGPAHADDEACAAPLPDLVEQVQRKGAEAAYRCLAGRDDAGPHLVQALGTLAEDAGGRERVQRALALFLIERLDAPLDAAAVRALNPSDRRLVRDAVYARRGRRSPSAEHDRVFSMFAWYQPDERFTNARLTDQDRANMQILDHPPAPDAPPAAEPAAAALPTAAPDPAAQVETWCGCAARPGGGVGALGLILGLGLVVRRRRACGGSPPR